MDINDILQQDRFKELDKYLTEEWEKTAGPEVLKKINETFPNKDRARKWYFSKSVFGTERPYDLCKRGEYEEVLKILGRIEHGVYS